MKKNLLPFLLIFITLLSCNKKSDSPEVLPDTGNSRTKFKDTLVTNTSANTNEIFASYIPLTNNLVVVQQISGSQYKLYTCDAEIKSLRSATINLGPDKLIEIEASKKEDAFFTLTATNNFQAKNPVFINAYVIQNPYLDSTSNCIPKIINYAYDPAFNLTPETNGNNYSTLNKFYKNGTIAWSKQLDGNYFDGRAIETDQNGNVFVLTSSRFPLTPKLNSTFSNTLVPYYDLVNDSNRISIYKFDRYGNQLFKKTIQNVKEISSFGFNPSLNLSDNYLTVTNTNNLYVFDVYGNLYSQSKPVINSCYSYVSAAISNPLIKQTYIIGTINYNQSTNFLNYMSVTNNGSTHSTISQSANLNTKFIVADNVGNVYMTQLVTDLRKMDRNGNLVINKGLIDGATSFGMSKRSSLVDKNNSLYVFRNDITQILVYKFDDKGNYD
ncbi:MAG: hypothetical protein JNJ40_13785 [Bacteroidia bacterium]|nr:hypothetical protein [Bacteroidia bacterium]